MSESNLLTVAEAARLVGLAPATLYKLAYQRRIRTFKVLGALRFARADLSSLVVERAPAESCNADNKQRHRPR